MVGSTAVPGKRGIVTEAGIPTGQTVSTTEAIPSKDETDSRRVPQFTAFDLDQHLAEGVQFVCQADRTPREAQAHHDTRRRLVAKARLVGRCRRLRHGWPPETKAPVQSLPPVFAVLDDRLDALRTAQVQLDKLPRLSRLFFRCGQLGQLIAGPSGQFALAQELLNLFGQLKKGQC